MAFPVGKFILLCTFVFQITPIQCLLCYRCDSQVDEDCFFYPTTQSVYEDCSQRPKINTNEQYARRYCAETLQKSVDDDVVSDLRSISIRLRPGVVVVVTGCVEETLLLTPSPMENANYICGKAVSRGANGVRVRRGCTPDLLLNGYDACVSASHEPKTSDIACFCHSDFCNHGSLLPFNDANLFLTLLTCLFLADYPLANI